jgi:hypothetical protein
MLDVGGAFAGGDYLSAARHLASGSWQSWASLGLIGHPADTADALTRFQNPEATFFSGVASWIAGDDDRARHILARCGDPHAQRLVDLIAKRPITVLAQLPWNRRGAWDLLGNLKDPAFRVFNVSFHPDDIQNRPYADARTLIPTGVWPDFFVAEMLEWHLIPPNIRVLGCPVLGHSSDFDLHIQTVAPWLDAFDELIVLDHVEWRAMSRAVRVPVSVFPKVFGVPARLPELTEQNRDIDVFLSGTVAHPYHLDKDRIVLDILKVRDIRTVIVQGFDTPDAYYRNLAKSKLSCTFIRHPGAMPTRGLEALALGCAVAVQEECALRLFASEHDGVFPYRTEAGHLADVIQSVLSGGNEYRARARRGADMVRREFALDRVASQYFRFLTFLAARPRPTRQGPDAERLLQKRPVVRKGWLPSYRFRRGLLMDWASMSVARLDRRLRDGATASVLNDLAREQLLAHYHDHANASKWLERVVVPLERALGQFPPALVPRFNLVRVLLHFGEPRDVRRALDLIDEALGSASGWHLDPIDDVLPWDFCPEWFNYRRYFDVVTEGMGTPDKAMPELVTVILASLNHYRARYADGHSAPRTQVELAAEAVRLDPGFPEYALYYCRLLLARGDETDLELVSTQVQQLMQHSARLVEILDIARRLPANMRGDWYQHLESSAATLWSALRLSDDLREPLPRSPFEGRRRIDRRAIQGAGEVL